MIRCLQPHLKQRNRQFLVLSAPSFMRKTQIHFWYMYYLSRFLRQTENVPIGTKGNGAVSPGGEIIQKKALRNPILPPNEKVFHLVLAAPACDCPLVAFDDFCDFNTRKDIGVVGEYLLQRDLKGFALSGRKWSL